MGDSAGITIKKEPVEHSDFEPVILLERINVTQSLNNNNCLVVLAEDGTGQDIVVKTEPEEDDDGWDVVEIGDDDDKDGAVVCAFCAFKHTNKLYVYTHEILTHDDLLAVGLDDIHQRKLIYKRYLIKDRGNYMCWFCCGKLNWKTKDDHLKHHIIKSTHRCRSCTFSSDFSVLNHQSRSHKNSEDIQAAIQYVNEYGQQHEILRTHLEVTEKSPRNSGRKRKTYLEMMDSPSLLQIHAYNSHSEMKKRHVDASQYDSGNTFAEFHECTFCDFRHSRELFTLSHEVIAHSEVILDILRKKDISAMKPKRYYHHIQGDVSNFCKLCGCKLSGNSIFTSAGEKHFLLHVQRNEWSCPYCTYSANVLSGTHIRMHELQLTGVKENFQVAKKFAESCENLGIDQGKGARRKWRQDLAIADGERSTQGVDPEENCIVRNGAGVMTEEAGVVRAAVTSTLTSDGNQSYPCLYCPFIHPDMIYTMTHEAITHGEYLLNVLTTHSDERLLRYVAHGAADNGADKCLLCGTDIMMPSIIRHVKCHLHILNPEYTHCHICTYSSKHVQGLYPHKRVHASEKRQDFLAQINAAKKFVLSLMGPGAFGSINNNNKIERHKRKSNLPRKAISDAEEIDMNMDIKVEPLSDEDELMEDSGIIHVRTEIDESGDLSESANLNVNDHSPTQALHNNLEQQFVSQTVDQENNHVEQFPINGPECSVNGAESLTNGAETCINGAESCINELESSTIEAESSVNRTELPVNEPESAAIQPESADSPWQPIRGKISQIEESSPSLIGGDADECAVTTNTNGITMERQSPANSDGGNDFEISSLSDLINGGVNSPPMVNSHITDLLTTVAEQTQNPDESTPLSSRGVTQQTGSIDQSSLAQHSINGKASATMNGWNSPAFKALKPSLLNSPEVIQQSLYTPAITSSLMRCPLCPFVCNDRNVIIHHVLLHTNDSQK